MLILLLLLFNNVITEGDFNFLTLFSFKKFISFVPLLLLLNPINAEQLLNKSEVLRKSNKCFKDYQHKVCNQLFLEMEKIQLVEYERNRYKCQTSILGLQTELIEAYYFKNFKNNQGGRMIKYVIKNC